MPGNNLFNNSNDQQNNATDLTGEDALKLLVGEDGKYATVEEMAKAMVHSQSHIAKLESEAAARQEADAKQASIQDVLDAINNQNSGTPEGGNESATPAPATPAPAEQEPTDVKAMVMQILGEQKAATTAEANVSKVADELAKRLGDSVASVYKATGDKLGVDLDELSKTSPDAVIALVAGQSKPSTQPTQTQQGGSFGNRFTESTKHPLTKSEIAKRFAAGEITRHEKFTLEHQGAAALGAKFFD